MDEQTLCKEASQGSVTAFAQLVTLHQQSVRAFLRRLTGNWAEADDLAQEVFVDAWLLINRFDPQQSLRTWLCGMAYRKYLASRRAFWRRFKREQIVAVESEWCANDAAHDAWLDLRRAMQALSVEQRAVVALCVAAEWSHTEAARVLDLPLGTVKSHLTRSRVLLGKHLVGYGATAVESQTNES